MNQLEPTVTTTDVDQRITNLERELRQRSVWEGYARFYAPLAVVSIALSGLPIFEDTFDASSGFSSTYGTLYDMAATHAGAPAVLALFLIGLLVTQLAFATVKPGNAALPIGIAVTSAVLVVMLLTKPGSGDPTPDLGSGGVAGLVLASCTIVLCTTHVIHLYMRRS